MRAPRVVGLVAVAGGLGVAACAAGLSDFSIGQGADGGTAEGGATEAGSGSSGGSDADGNAEGADACAANGTGAVGTLGCPCSTTAGPACAGNAQTQALLWTGGVWVPNGTCASGQLFDTQAGANQGTCQPIDPNCTGADPGDDVCSNATTVVQCGPDLLSDSPVVTCTNQACVAGACAGICTPGASQCASGADAGTEDGDAANGVETCAADGTWQAAVACVHSTCSAGACSGSCSAGATQCSGTSAVQSCGSGMWAAPTICTNQACVSGVCTGVCTPGATVCATDKDIETCGTDGQWGAAKACTHACVFGTHAYGGVCSPGATQACSECANSGTETCSTKGQWGSCSASCS